ncbi:MAG: pyridoxal-phosphate-dependent aminotransferase family protein [Anaerolineae bacterium]
MKGRSLLMIPGPIEFEPSVLAAMAEPTTSHVAPEFVEVFGRALEHLRQVFLSDDGQPMVVAGSGTLAMDLAGANLVEPGDRALVVNTGYFGDRFSALLQRYGAAVTQVRGVVGSRPSLEEVEAALQRGPYKLMTVTHVDTSTGVVADVRGLASLAHHYGALLIVDGVCSVAGEELRMSEWGVDVALTASQKAIGVPPGLALLVASPRAIDAFRQRRTQVCNYYADWTNWLPIMEAYEQRRALYFATPPVNLVGALNVSLKQILAEGLDERFRRHQALGRACRAGLAALGLGQVPIREEFAANTMSAPRYPAGVSGGDLLRQARVVGVILAGGLHPDIRNEYFRIGHMGATNMGDVLATLGAIEVALRRCGHHFEAGAALAAAAATI